jgi:hypothetical protein
VPKHDGGPVNVTDATNAAGRELAVKENDDNEDNNENNNNDNEWRGGLRFVAPLL